VDTYQWALVNDIQDVLQSKWHIHWQLGTTTDLVSKFCAEGVDVYVVASSTNLRDWSMFEQRLNTDVVHFKTMHRDNLFLPRCPHAHNGQYYTIVAVHKIIVADSSTLLQVHTATSGPMLNKMRDHQASPPDACDDASVDCYIQVYTTYTTTIVHL